MIFRWYMSNTKSTILNLITNEVKINDHMFHAWMKNWIGAKMSSTNIVAINHKCLWKLNVKFNKKRAHLIGFGNCSSNRFVFNFCRWMGNSTLLLGTSWDGIVTKINNISTCWSEVILITGLIGIRENMEQQRRVMME